MLNGIISLAIKVVPSDLAYLAIDLHLVQTVQKANI